MPNRAGYHKDYYLDNRERLLLRAKLNHALHRERDNLRCYLWHRRYPKSCEDKNIRRRAQKYGCSPEVRLTKSEWELLKRIYGHSCAYCGGQDQLTKDHDIPLSRGGDHTFANVVPACLSCNSKKHTKTGAEFRRDLTL